MANDKGDGKKIGLRFSEKMSGYFLEGETDFERGEKSGKIQNSPLSFDVTIDIEEVSDFCKLIGHKAALTGTVSCTPLGQNLPIRNGRFGLFRPHAATGKRHMTYSFDFRSSDGRDYSLSGYKVIFDDPHEVDVMEDMTRLFTRIYRGTSADAPLFGSGILHFRMESLPSMLASFEVTNTSSLIAKAKAISQFFSFCYGELRDTYVAKHTAIYHTEYENLVLRGKLSSGSGGERNFFFFSGVHDKDFPWGDDEFFWDAALIIEKDGGGWERYALTDRIIDGLELDVGKGRYRYSGPIYRVLEGYQVSRSEMKRSPLPGHLREVRAEIEFSFEAQAYDPVDIPFSFIPDYGRFVPQELVENVREWVPQLQSLGWHMIPHKVLLKESRISLQDGSSSEEYLPSSERSLGEAERSTFMNIRWPRLYYNYFCALNPERGEITVKVRSDALRANRKDAVLDKIEETLGKVVSHLVRLDLNIGPHGPEILTAAEERPFRKVDDLLEINNDHFPTAVFQRRVVSLQDERGEFFLAMEEDMDPLNLGAIDSDRVVKVAAVRGPDKFKDLDDVLEATGFFAELDASREGAGKSKEEFSIIIKPNFMFMYSTKDPSTYTDPQLIEHLMDRIFERGYRNLACAEARSTYGVFFTNREVKTVAQHIGLAGKNYRIIDLSEDLEEYPFSGKLGNHYVNREWKDADFRIAFAKNKTHSYSRYTLTLKAVYGALPMENKFLEYHHKRDIFSTTIEFLRHFPIHFALIDAFVSADGPFGIFADKKPNRTETIIGGEDPVAVDWIGAAKMGLDPMVSDYMKQAVAAFGKPQIKMIGDRTLYPDWVNVTDVIPLGAFGMLDKNYYFGNLFYSVFSYMEDFFQYKDPGFGRKFARLLADPIKSLFFQKIESGEMNQELNRELYEFFTGGK